jgi:PASTA domain/Protein of unknown function (DUF4232)
VTDWDPDEPDATDLHIRRAVRQLERPVDIEAVSRMVLGRVRRRRLVRRALAAVAACIVIAGTALGATWALGSGPSTTKLDVVSPPTTAATSHPQGSRATPVVTPDVVGQNYEEAQQNMVVAGLGPTYVWVHSSTVPAGVVIAQSPTAGTLFSPLTGGGDLTVSIGPASVPGARPCQASDLSARPGPPISEATGASTQDLGLMNVSGRTCVLDGYPTLTLVDSAGHRLGFTYSHAGDEMTTDASPAPVYIPPDSEAWVRFDKYRCDVPAQDTAAYMFLVLPSDGGAVRVSTRFSYCQEAPSLVVFVSPFEPVERLLYPTASQLARNR